MVLPPPFLRRRRLLITALLALVGLGGSAAIYLAAEDQQQNALLEGYLNSNKYHHDVAAIGGEWNVLADETWRWFTSLWHGRSLAYTVVVITFLAAGGYWCAAGWLPCGGEEDADKKP
jgi:hypothetical protein